MDRLFHVLFSSEESSDEETDESRFRERINFELNDSSFFEAFRMKKSQVDYVIQNVGEALRPQTRWGPALSPVEKVLIFLHWTGNGAQYHGISHMHHVSKATVCRVVHQVSECILSNMLHTEVKWPESQAELRDIPTDFFRKAGFPSVAGCVDGTLINIDAPHVNEQQFVDRYGDHSLNVMVVCGPDLSIYAVNANWPGSVHDARVLRNTRLFQNFEDGWRPFPEAVLLGDSGYPMREWLMTPLQRNPENPLVRRYNTAHARTRRVIENSLGVLKEKFPCLNYLRLQPRRASKIIVACVVLHNVALKIDRDEESVLHEPPAGEDEPEEEEPEEDFVEPRLPDVERRLQRILNFFR